MTWLAKFIKEDSGATAVEYAIMAAAIAAVILGIVIVIGRKTIDPFTKVGTSMNQITGS